MCGPGDELAAASFLTRPPSRLRNCNTAPSLPGAVGVRGGDADQHGAAVAQIGALALVDYAREDHFLGGGWARRVEACTRVPPLPLLRSHRTRLLLPSSSASGCPPRR